MIEYKEDFKFVGLDFIYFRGWENRVGRRVFSFMLEINFEVIILFVVWTEKCLMEVFVD